jgi:hypothetical protein
MSPSIYRDRPGAAFRTAVLSFKLAISALIVLSVMPFVTGDFKVDLPGPSSFNQSFQDGQFVFAGPVKISNGGVYDVSDVTVDYQIDNSTGHRLTEKSVEWGILSARSEVTRMLIFSIDYESLIAESDWMLFHRDSLSINVEINASYTLGLISFSIESQMALPWNGPIFSTQFESSESNHTSNPVSIETIGSTSSPAVNLSIGNSFVLDVPHVFQTNDSYRAEVRVTFPAILLAEGDRKAIE